MGAVTMEAVAHLAKVGKPTIYRSWPNREALAMAAMMATASPKTSVRETSSALDDLARQIRKVADAFSSPRGRNAALMVASADPDSELSKAFRNQVMLVSREEGRAILIRAITEGTVRRDIKIDVVLDMIYGAIFYRLLIGHAPLGEAFVNQLMGEALRGFTSVSARLA
jgi:AcrR family transcriptional regulator